MACIWSFIAWFRSAILASLFLGEELGHLGRIGSTLCLLGSLIIVVHAPEDKEVQTVDEILHFAIQPGTCHVVSYKPLNFADIGYRFFAVLPYSPGLHPCDGVLCIASIRQEESGGVHLYMLAGGINIHHGDQRIRHRTQTHLERE